MRSEDAEALGVVLRPPQPHGTKTGAGAPCRLRCRGRGAVGVDGSGIRYRRLDHACTLGAAIQSKAWRPEYSSSACRDCPPARPTPSAAQGFDDGRVQPSRRAPPPRGRAPRPGPGTRTRHSGERSRRRRSLRPGPPTTRHDAGRNQAKGHTASSGAHLAQHGCAPHPAPYANRGPLLAVAGTAQRITRRPRVNPNRNSRRENLAARLDLASGGHRVVDVERRAHACLSFARAP